MSALADSVIIVLAGYMTWLAAATLPRQTAKEEWAAAAVSVFIAAAGLAALAARLWEAVR